MLWIPIFILTLLVTTEGIVKSWDHSPISGSSPLKTKRRDNHIVRYQRDINNGRNKIAERAIQGRGVESLPIDTYQTQIVENNHKYYSSRVLGPTELQGHDLLVDLLQEEPKKATVLAILSKAHKQALRVKLSFDFPFYGHPLKHITIATGGFIFMGDVLHSMLTATQYVAPLMANFNPKYSNESTIRYKDNGTCVVVQWDKVRLHERENAGNFTFLAALFKDGHIVFGYKEIPLQVQSISPEQHPVKSGLSDAFVVVDPFLNDSESQRRYIYEYHRVQVDLDKIKSQTVVEFTPLPTCLQYTTCDQCLTFTSSLNCSWCHVLQRCSSGIDRYRQDWITYGCEKEAQSTSCEDYIDFYTAADSTIQTSSPEMDSTPNPFMDTTTEDDTKTKHQGDACLQYTTCDQCLTFTPSLNCSWCHVLRRCSSGRNGQDWITYGCEKEAQSTSCEVYTPADPTIQTISPKIDVSTTASMDLTTEDDTKMKHQGDEPLEEMPKKSVSHVHSGTIVGIILAVLLITVIILAVIYINHHKGKQGRHCCIEYHPHHWAVMKFNNHGSPGVYTVVDPTPGLDKDGFMETEQ
ncbi:hypothetical protein GDO81_013154 [Engystomops pustulosus]|uniref:PSI domain-containing protein n=1 Tax=Engystomops pustulosus TaxID=76066 RepID=A0AAV7AXB6_ENGPU|nr:hypothetical protein GDO81_013154 [Engystomops pustulosus]